MDIRIIYKRRRESVLKHALIRFNLQAADFTGSIVKSFPAMIYGENPGEGPVSIRKAWVMKEPFVPGVTFGKRVKKYTKKQRAVKANPQNSAFLLTG
jgi:hypothetical protein